MDNNNWTTRLRKLPNRVLAHPLSGAYAAWLGMTHYAIVTPFDDAAKLSALGLTGAFGITLATGKKFFIENDVLRQTAHQLHQQTKLKLTKEQRLAVKQAFHILYDLGGIEATRGISKALPIVTSMDAKSKPWLCPNSSSDAVQPEKQLRDDLVEGALYFAMQEPRLFTGKLSSKLQEYIVEKKPEWVGDCPYHFTERLVDRQRPGLLNVALAVYGLHHDSYTRKAAVREWLDNQAIPPSANALTSVASP